MGDRAGTRRSTFESASFKVAERNYRVLVESIADYAIFMLGPDGRIESWNAGAVAIYGYSPDEIVGEPVGVLYPEEDRAAGEATRPLAAAQEADRYEREGFRVRKDGSRFWASSVLTALWDGSRLLGFAEVTRDLTARKKTEDTTQEALARAEIRLGEAKRLESVGRLAAAITHDFNNALSVILTYCDLLQTDLGPAPGPAGDVMEIQKAASRAARMTQQLLTFSKWRSAPPEPVDLSEWLTGVHPVLSKEAGRNIDVLMRLARPLGPVQVDVLGLEHALLCLVTNAREAMPSGGIVTVSTALEPMQADRGAGAYVVLAVTDTGVGMDEVTQARCFEPFFTTRTPGESAGMGLAIVQGAIRQSGGHVRLRSAPGKGTTVSVYLPASGR